MQQKKRATPHQALQVADEDFLTSLLENPTREEWEKEKVLHGLSAEQSHTRRRCSFLSALFPSGPCERLRLYQRRYQLWCVLLGSAVSVGPYKCRSAPSSLGRRPLVVRCSESVALRIPGNKRPPKVKNGLTSGEPPKSKPTSRHSATLRNYMLHKPRPIFPAILT